MTLQSLQEEIRIVLNYTLFSINETPISLSSILIFVLILFIFIAIGKIINKIVLSKLFGKFNLEEGIKFTFHRLTQYLIVFIGVIIAFQLIGIDLTGLAVVLGFLSVGIGFGLQNITSNFISGIILLFERPIKVGDRVTVGETEGDVKHINIRSTTIKSINNIAYIVPNSEFVSSTVINWSHGDQKLRVDINVGVSYNSDIDLVLKVLTEIAEDNEDILKDPKPNVMFLDFGDSAWNLKLLVWISDPKKHIKVKSDINCEIVRKFREYNIEIPFPQRDLHILTDKTK